MKLVNRWETSDGSIFGDEDIAQAYEDRCDIINYIADNPLYGCDGRSVDAENILLWIRDDAPRLAFFLLPEDK